MECQILAKVHHHSPILAIFLLNTEVNIVRDTYLPLEERLLVEEETEGETEREKKEWK